MLAGRPQGREETPMNGRDGLRTPRPTSLPPTLWPRGGAYHLSLSCVTPSYNLSDHHVPLWVLPGAYPRSLNQPVTFTFYCLLK